MIDFVEQVDGAISNYCDNGKDYWSYIFSNEGWS